MKKTTPAATGPETKLSEAILDVAQPFFEPLGTYPTIHGMKNVLTLVIVGWNAYAMEKPIWGKPGAVERARKRFEDPHYPEGVRVLFDGVLERRASLYASDLRLVGEWSVASNGAGGFSLDCEARLPGR